MATLRARNPADEHPSHPSAAVSQLQESADAVLRRDRDHPDGRRGRRALPARVDVGDREDRRAAGAVGAGGVRLLPGAAARGAGGGRGDGRGRRALGLDPGGGPRARRGSAAGARADHGRAGEPPRAQRHGADRGGRRTRRGARGQHADRRPGAPGRAAGRLDDDRGHLRAAAPALHPPAGHPHPERRDDRVDDGRRRGDGPDPAARHGRDRRPPLPPRRLPGARVRRRADGDPPPRPRDRGGDRAVGLLADRGRGAAGLPRARLRLRAHRVAVAAVARSSACCRRPAPRRRGLLGPGARRGQRRVRRARQGVQLDGPPARGPAGGAPARARAPAGRHPPRGRVVRQGPGPRRRCSGSSSRPRSTASAADCGRARVRDAAGRAARGGRDARATSAQLPAGDPRRGDARCSTPARRAEIQVGGATALALTRCAPSDGADARAGDHQRRAGGAAVHRRRARAVPLPREPGRRSRSRTSICTRPCSARRSPTS